MSAYLTSSVLSRLHQPIGSKADIHFRDVSEGIGGEMGEERAGSDVSERIRQVL